MEKIKALIYSIHAKYDFHSLFMWILCLSNIFYLFYILAIAYHNVIIWDDYWFMVKYNEYGLFGSLSWWFQNWQGRFSPQLFINFIVKGYESVPSLLPYTIFLISIFLYAIVRLLNIMLPKPIVHVKNHHFLIFNFSLFLFNLFLIVNFDFTVFYWVTVSTMYFGGIAFALLGITELISKSKSIFSYFIIAFGFTYAGSSAEHFGATCVLLLALYIVFVSYAKKRKLVSAFDSIFQTKARFAFLVCLVSFLIMIAAPGNEIRRNDYPRASFVDALLIGIKSLYYLFTVLIAEKAKYLLVLSFPFIYLGTVLRRKGIIDDFNASLFIIISITIFTFFLYICLVPIAYAVGGIGVFRALTHIAFFLVIYVAFLSFLIGYRTSFSRKIAFTLSFICLISFMVISRDRIKINLPETIKYTDSEKKRINKVLLLKEKGNKRPVIVDSLYKSPKNVLVHIEIDKYGISHNLSEGLGLGFEVFLIKSK